VIEDNDLTDNRIGPWDIAKGSPRNCADKWDGDQAAAGRTV
jgi:hypothetical protein